MAQLQKGTTYITGDQVTAANLNALVDSGILTPGAVTDQTAKTVPLAADTILLHSAADTALRKTTMTQLFATPQPLGATTPSSVAATTGTFSSTLGVTGVATLGNGAILGTPASGTITNLTGTASININGTVGATTPSTIAATTISATGTVTFGTGGTGAQNDLAIVSGSSASGYGPAIRLNRNSVVKGQIGTQSSILGDNSDNVLVYSGGANVGIYASGTLAATITSTGLNSTAIGATTPSTGAFSTLSSTGIYTNTNSAGAAAIVATSTSVNGAAISVKSTDTGGRDWWLLSNGSGSGVAGTLSLYDSVANVRALTATSAGFIGIGTNTPAVRLDVSGTINSTGLAVTGTLSATGTITAGDLIQMANTANANRINIFSNVYGFGIDSSDLVAYANTGNGFSVKIGGSGYNSTLVTRTTSTGLAVTGALSATGAFTGPTTAIINGSTMAPYNATLLINNNGSAVNGIRLADSYASAGTTEAIGFYRATNLVGNITTTLSATAYNTSSDYRLKDITGSVVDSGTFIDALKPKVGTWKVDGSKFVGFLAHEFAEVSPLSVSGEKDAVDADGKPVYQSMQAGTSEVIANLVAELQSLRKRLAALESK